MQRCVEEMSPTEIAVLLEDFVDAIDELVSKSKDDEKHGAFPHFGQMLQTETNWRTLSQLDSTRLRAWMSRANHLEIAWKTLETANGCMRCGTYIT